MSRSSASTSSNNYSICLICGSHTDLVLNIFEPRCGPNIVDVIFAKFKFKAEKNSSDKFICYDCNNWLINWFSLQNINEANERAIGDNGAEGSKDIGKNTNLNVIANYELMLRAKSQLKQNFLDDVPETSHNQQGAWNFVRKDIRNDDYRMTDKLKSLRKPDKKSKKHGKPVMFFKQQGILVPSLYRKILKKYKKMLNSSVMLRNPFARMVEEDDEDDGNETPEKCETIKNNRVHDIEQDTVSSTSSMFLSHVVEKNEHNQFFYEINSKKLVNNSSSSPLVENNILTMLKKQGTILISETEKPAKPDPDGYLTSNKLDIVRAEHTKDDAIILNFNSAITEVFPLHSREIAEQENQDTPANIGTSSIYKNLPKSLSISLMDEPFWSSEKSNNKMVTIVID